MKKLKYLTFILLAFSLWIALMACASMFSAAVLAVVPEVSARGVILTYWMPAYCLTVFYIFAIIAYNRIKKLYYRS